MSRPQFATLGRRQVLLAGACTAFLTLIGMGLIVLAFEPSEGPGFEPSGARTTAAWHDDLRTGLSDRWRIYSNAEGASSTAAVDTGHGLVLGLETLGCEASAVCTVGTVTRKPLEIGTKLTVGALLDWRAPANASYRAAGLLLTTTAPRDGQALEDLQNTLWLEVVGVPPGKTARLFGAQRHGPLVKPLFTDGWPADRAGKAIRRVQLEIELTPVEATLSANGEVLARGAHALSAGPVWVVLYTRSHANFPARAIAFERVSADALAVFPRSVAAHSTWQGS